MEFLRAQGMRIVARNWRWRGGEVDIIAKDGNALVFVEVKAREKEEFARVEEAVDAKSASTFGARPRPFFRESPGFPCGSMWWL